VVAERMVCAVARAHVVRREARIRIAIAGHGAEPVSKVAPGFGAMFNSKIVSDDAVKGTEAVLVTKMSFFPKLSRETDGG
jgi:hypothetical protein